MGRVLGVDLGARRIGLALSDPNAVVATPHAVFERTGDPATDRAAILAAARDAGALRIIVGLPRSLSGGLGPAARAALEEAEALRAEAGGDVTVETHDERFTTVSAERALTEEGGRGAARGRARRRVVDKVAAAVMLQSYLDARRARGTP